MARRTRENVLAEMLQKVLAYNISQSSGCGKAFRGRTDGAGRGLIKINYSSRRLKETSSYLRK
jgi:hypothetical protein